MLDTLEGLDEHQLKLSFMLLPRGYRYSSPYRRDTKGLQATLKSLQAFYRADLLCDFDICRRWGLVRTVGVTSQFTTLIDEVQLPDWFNALLFDLSESFTQNSYDLTTDEKLDLSSIPYLNIKWLSALLAHYDFDTQVLFQLLLQSANYTSNNHLLMAHLLTTVDLPNWLVEVDAISLLDKINADGKIQLIKALGSYQKLDVLLELLIQLATDSAKTVRQICPPLLGKLETTVLLDAIVKNFAGFNASRRKELEFNCRLWRRKQY